MQIDVKQDILMNAEDAWHSTIFYKGLSGQAN